MITPEEVKNLNDEKLSIPSNFRDINELAEYTIASFQLKEAHSLAKILESKLSLKGKPYLSQQDEDYQVLIARLKFLALNFCTLNEVFDLFENKAAYIISDQSIDVLDRIRALMIEFLVFERDEIKRRIRERLMSNDQEITKTGPSTESRNKSGTIANWLSDYVQNVGAGVVDKLEVAEYLGGNKDILKLSPEEKKKVTNLINIFYFLQISSTTPEGLEELLIFKTSDNAFYFIEKGVLKKVISKKDNTFGSKSNLLDNQPIKLFGQIEEPDLEEPKAFSQFLPPPPSEKVAAEKIPTSIEEETVPVAMKGAQNQDKDELANEVLRIYEGDPKDKKKIEAEKEIIKKAVKNDNLKLRDEFYKAVQKKRIHKTIAVLMLMAEVSEIDNFLREDEKLQRFLLSVWPKMYGLEVASRFKKDPGSWLSVKLFVQYILQKRLDLAESEAARIGVQLGNVFKRTGQKELSKLAYFNAESKEFKWLED